MTTPTRAQRLYDARVLLTAAQGEVEKHGVSGALAPARELIAQIDLAIIREPRADFGRITRNEPSIDHSRIEGELLAPLRAIPTDLLTPDMLDLLDTVDTACREHIASERRRPSDDVITDMRRRVYEHLTTPPPAPKETVR